MSIVLCDCSLTHVPGCAEDDRMLLLTAIFTRISQARPQGRAAEPMPTRNRIVPPFCRLEACATFCSFCRPPEKAAGLRSEWMCGLPRACAAPWAIL